jgi:hypothetical protein
MGRFPDVGILGRQILRPRRSPQPSVWRDPSLKWMALSAVGLGKIRSLNFEWYQKRPFAEPTEVDCVSACAMMIRRDLLEDSAVSTRIASCTSRRATFVCENRAPSHGSTMHPSANSCTKRGTSNSDRLRTFLDFQRSQFPYHRKHGGVAAAIAARGASRAGLRSARATDSGAFAGLRARPGARYALERSGLANEPIQRSGA